MRGSEKPTETFVFFFIQRKKKKHVSKAKASQTSSIPLGHFSSSSQPLIFFFIYFLVNKTTATF